MYKELSDPDLASDLARLNAQYGRNERLLDHDQRNAIFTPLFDDAAGDFVKYRDELLNAAATYAQWGQATGIPILREIVRNKHLPFKQHLTRFSGASLDWSRGTALPHLTERVTYRVLRDRGVTSVFGIFRPPRDAWPYQEDANGEQLVEEVSKRLDPDRSPPLNRHWFSLQQRTALRGAEAIAAVLDYTPHEGDEGDVDVLITKCCTWYAALQSMSGMVSTPALMSEPSAAMVDDGRRGAFGRAFMSS